ncbi:MAG: FIST signal transduction protein, partial [Candidatus Thorarchaeota archaeon]
MRYDKTVHRLETLGIPNIEVGFAQCSGDEAFQTGTDVANLALENIKWHQVSVAFVSTSTSFDLGELLKGIGSIIDEAPVIGVASSNEAIKGEVTLTVIASSFLQVHVSSGNAVSTSWKKAVRQATKKKSIKPYFTLGSDILQQLMSSGKHAFGILLTPGGTGKAKPYSSEILETLTHKSDGRLPFVGGTINNNLDGNLDTILLNEDVLKDSMLLAIFETNLQTGIGMAHGFTPSKRKLIITKAIANEILEIDNKPAAEVYANLMSCSLKKLEGKHRDMTTGATFGIYDLHGHPSIVITSRTTKRKGIIISESLPSGTVLYLMESDEKNLVQAKQEAFKKAILRGNITQPEFCFSFSNIYRNNILNQYSDRDESDLQP